MLKLQSLFGGILLKINIIYNYFRDEFLFQVFKSKVVKLPKLEKEILVLGNGPSLSNLIHNQLLHDYELFVCNGFALTKDYENLKPKHYFLKDYLYFELGNSFVLNRENDVLSTWESIVSKTNWELTIYTSLVDLNLLVKLKNTYSFSDNIKWVNVYPIEFRGRNKFKYISKGIGLIGGMTVTHFSTLVAILCTSNNVHLAGIDHDWINNIFYDENSHRLYLSNNHFYNSEKIYYGEGIYVNNDIVLELYSQFKSFEGFKVLSQFATFLNVPLSRCTKSYLHFINYKPLHNG